MIFAPKSFELQKMFLKCFIYPRKAQTPISTKTKFK